MKYLFYLGHPAHYHLFKNTIANLKGHGHLIEILIKKKDVLENLLNSAGLAFSNIQQKVRWRSKISMAWNLAKRDCKMLKVARKFRPDLMIGTSAEITHVGKLLKIPSAVVNEDDFDAVLLFSRMAYPLATHILTPSSCRVGPWKSKNIAYDGYHELAYLSPQYFSPEENKVAALRSKNGRYFILRLARLTAYHDRGKTGIREEMASKIINILEPHGSLYITAERELEPQFEKYRIPLNPADMHHALFFADLFIGDSQTMTAEAAVLGTPALRFCDFVGKLGYLEELEHKYGLTYGIKTSEPEKLFDRLREFLSIPDLKPEWARRRRKMLSEKIDVTKFMTWFLENYPQSAATTKSHPLVEYHS